MITLCELSSLPAKEDVKTGHEGFDTYHQEYLDFVKKVRHDQNVKEDTARIWVQGLRSGTQVTKS